LRCAGIAPELQGLVMGAEVAAWGEKIDGASRKSTPPSALAEGR
jgi:hypothetical protein